MDKTSKQFVCSHCGEELKELNEASQLVSETVEFVKQCIVQGRNKDELTGEAKERYEHALSLMKRMNNLYK